MKESLRITIDLGDKKIIAATLGQLGKIHMEKEEYPLALQAYLLAYEIFNELKSPYVQMASRDLAALKDKMGEQEFNIQLKRLVKNDVV
jgi:hypothetical protein